MMRYELCIIIIIIIIIIMKWFDVRVCVYVCVRACARARARLKCIYMKIHCVSIHSHMIDILIFAVVCIPAQ